MKRNKRGQFTKDPRPERKTGKYLSCENCGKYAYVIKARLNTWRYCSSVCSYSARKGKTMNTGRTHFKKGQIPHNYLGEKAGYFAVHKWVYKTLPNIRVCLYCGIDEKLQWANVSGEYKREIEDWIRLCAKCHVNYDIYVLGRGKMVARYG